MRQMKIGLYATSTGGHVAGWRHPEAHADIGANVTKAAEMARLAEEGRLDFLFLADSLTMRGATGRSCRATATVTSPSSSPLRCCPR
jgi:hypothetical protein